MEDKSSTEITKEYLEQVIEKYGPDQKIMNTNCGGVPQEPGDYAFIHGTAKELLERINRGEKIYMC